MVWSLSSTHASPSTASERPRQFMSACRSAGT
jgi:hypothetical protein